MLCKALWECLPQGLAAALPSSGELGREFTLGEEKPISVIEVQGELILLASHR